MEHGSTFCNDFKQLLPSLRSHLRPLPSLNCTINFSGNMYSCMIDFFGVCSIYSLDHQSDDEDVMSFPGKRQLISFLSWLDYIDQLSKEAHKVCLRFCKRIAAMRSLLKTFRGLQQNIQRCATFPANPSSC